MKTPLKTTSAKVSDFQQDPHNANQGTDRGSELLVDSLRELKAGRSVLVDKHDVAIAGNKTLKAAEVAGIEDAIVVETDGSQLVVVRRKDLDLATDPEAKKLAIVDNRTSELGLNWNPEVLDEISKTVDLSGLFQPDEWADLMASLGEIPGDGNGDRADGVGMGKDLPPEDDEAIGDLLDRAASGAIEPRCKVGEIWKLGMHRLAIGDSTNSEYIRRLMGGEKAALCWTDPPYNVAYDPEERVTYFSEDRKAKPLGTIMSDKMSDGDFRSFLDQIYGCINDSLGEGCPIYICHADTMGHHFRAAFVAQPWKLQSCLIWLKTVLTFGRADYHWKHEPILYGWKEGAAHRWYGDRTKTTILEFAAPHYNKAECDTEGYIHSCQKPTDLIKFCLGNSSAPGDIVLDLFGGSGSTMIACEYERRRCFMSELDLRFAEAIIQRWENLTGEKAMCLT